MQLEAGVTAKLAIINHWQAIMYVQATNGGTDMKGRVVRLAARDRTGSRSDPLPLGAARGWPC